MTKQKTGTREEWLAARKELQEPDGDLAPYYYQLLDQVPKGRGDEVRARRHDEYADAT